jgi:hypothetical protein
MYFNAENTVVTTYTTYFNVENTVVTKHITYVNAENTVATTYTTYFNAEHTVVVKYTTYFNVQNTVVTTNTTYFNAENTVVTTYTTFLRWNYSSYYIYHVPHILRLKFSASYQGSTPRLKYDPQIHHDLFAPNKKPAKKKRFWLEFARSRVRISARPGKCESSSLKYSTTASFGILTIHSLPSQVI